MVIIVVSVVVESFLCPHQSTVTEKEEDGIIYTVIVKPHHGDPNTQVKRTSATQTSNLKPTHWQISDKQLFKAVRFGWEFKIMHQPQHFLSHCFPQTEDVTGFVIQHVLLDPVLNASSI